jgi:hypothetical protein
MRYTQADVDNAITVDKLLEDLVEAKKLGFIDGNSKVLFGTGCLYNMWPVKTIVAPDPDLSLLVFSSDTEEDLLAVGHTRTEEKG